MNLMVSPLPPRRNRPNRRRMTMMMPTLLLLALLRLSVVTVDAFQELHTMSPLASSLLHTSMHSMPVVHDIFSSITSSTSSSISTTTTTTIANANTALLNPLTLYMNSLQTNPLATKMMTGATLALTGDYIAQSRIPDDEIETYDKRRAASFALFDSAYRATQHVLYPIVVANCQGQFLNGVVPLDTNTAASIEQTLVSQLVIVPLLYYPVFYGVTSFVQGLTWEGTVERAKQTFVPLMKRNLLFWIPVQFVQFNFLPEDFQIPFLSVCGLCWTLILSVMAGSAKQYTESTSATTSSTVETTAAAAKEEQQHEYCVTGIEEECVIGEDGLFPHTGAIQEITDEMKEMAHEVTMEWERRVGSGSTSSSSISNMKEEDSIMAKEEEEEEQEVVLPRK